MNPSTETTDSTIGTYGSLALLLSILIKFTALNTIAPQSVPTTLLAGHILGRW